MLDLTDFTALLDHDFAWAVYLTAAAVVLLAYWGVSRRWWFELRWLLFALLAVLLFVPAPVPGSDLRAPAMIMLALSPFTGSPELIAAVVSRLLLYAVAAIALVVIVLAIRRTRARAGD